MVRGWPAIFLDGVVRLGAVVVEVPDRVRPTPGAVTGRGEADVVRVGRAMACQDGVEHVILKKTGEIQRRTTYSRNRLRRKKG